MEHHTRISYFFSTQRTLQIKISVAYNEPVISMKSGIYLVVSIFWHLLTRMLDVNYDTGQIKQCMTAAEFHTEEQKREHLEK